MDKKVFISYHDENIVIANGMVEFLGDSVCWMASKETKPIDDNLLSEEDQKFEAIEKANFLVLILSRFTNYEETNIKEVKHAFDNNTKVITFKIDDIETSGALEPYLNKGLWFDAYKGSTYEHLQKLEHLISG